MSALAVWFAYQMPWWVWGLAALALAAAVARLMGLRAGVLAAGLLGLAVAYRRGAQAGFAAHQAEGEKDARRAIEAADLARAAALRRDGDAVRLRDDDGFWRD